MKDAEVNYSDSVKETGKGYGLEPPHVHCFIGMLTTLLKEEVGAKAREALERLQTELMEQEPAAAAAVVTHCRLRRCYSAERQRLTVAFGPTHCIYLQDLTAALIQTGAEAKTGIAPPGGLEQALQKLIDEANEN